MATASATISLRTPVATRILLFSMTTSIISNILFSLCPDFAEINKISAYGMKLSTCRIRSVYFFTVLLSFSIASHLLTAITIPFPLSCAMPAIFASCSVTPSMASMTIITTSARSTAVTARMMLYRSISSLILFLRRRPAVSINTYSFPLYLMSVSIASLVVPAISDTITRSSCASLLIREDFPTFGFPIIAIFGRSSSSMPAASSGKCFTTSSSISPSPSMEEAETGCGSPIPRL